jgi:putative ABC transport system permease protein
MTLPKRYVDDVRQNIPQAKAVTWANWFGAKDPAHETEFFATIAVDPKTYWSLYPEVTVPAEQVAKFNEDRRGAIVGDALVKKMGWKVGDRVTLRGSIIPGDVEFNIDGIYTTTNRSIDRSTFLFQWDYMNDLAPPRMKDQVGWIITKIDDPTQAANVSVAIDKLFDERDIQTVSQDERAFNASFLAGFGVILDALDLVTVAILVIMMLILGNTIAMGVRERTSEYATLRAIGFLPRHVVTFVLGEAVSTALLGGAVGVALSYPLVTKGMGRFIEENMGNFFPFFRVGLTAALAALALAVGLGLVAALPPAYRTWKLNVITALRRVG